MPFFDRKFTTEEVLLINQPMNHAECHERLLRKNVEEDCNLKIEYKKPIKFIQKCHVSYLVFHNNTRLPAFRKYKQIN